MNIHRTLGEPSKKIGKSWDLSQRGGGGLTQSQLFKTKTKTIENSDFVGIFSQYGRGSPVPTKKKSQKITSKITNHQKNDFS